MNRCGLSRAMQSFVYLVLVRLVGCSPEGERVPDQMLEHEDVPEPGPGRCHGTAMLHSPRPYVAATIEVTSGVSVRLCTAAFGNPVPRFDQLVGCAASASNTPTSVATTSSSRRMSRSVACAAGKLPLMS